MTTELSPHLQLWEHHGDPINGIQTGDILHVRVDQTDPGTGRLYLVEEAGKPRVRAFAELGEGRILGRIVGRQGAFCKLE
jgi:hypothetical protein